MTAMEFSTMLISMKDNLRKFALYLTYSMDDANDLLQDTYLKALSSKDKFIEYTNFRAWVFTIMKNTFINRYRKSLRENTVLLNTENTPLLNIQTESQLGRPDSELVCKEINNDIEALRYELKIPFRMHTEGYKYIEIAQILNLKIGTVKSRIYLARKKLMETLDNYQ
jgi:RNA polymerase sigma-70 factor (ECF subfamily)